MSLSTLDIERNVADALASANDTPLIDRILRAYGHPAGSVSRLRNGALNKAKEPGDLLWKGKLFYRETLPGMLRSESEDCRRNPAIRKLRPRFIIISDGSTWAAYDTRTQTPLEFPIDTFLRHYDFFLPWADYEKEETILEKAADIKAAQKMGELYDALKKNNAALSDHDMNVFMARLLFCFFAEDSGIFPQEAQFTHYISEHAAADGSDLHEHIGRVFRILNTPEDDALRQQVSHTLAAFPYVNGGLFSRNSQLPVFTPKALKAVLAAGNLNWSDINTDIFGSMFQACVDSRKRANLGEHYTSVPNIKKVLKPLFLDKLERDAQKAKGNQKEAQKFIKRLRNIRCFDPACGSGNFLLIAFEEMRKLEMDVLEATPGMLLMPGVSINQFYGIEIDDFPHEIAMLSLWLVEHQMNQAFEERFGKRVATLPLKPQQHIILGNALRMDWDDVCPRYSEAPLFSVNPLFANADSRQAHEVYVFGNPPYLGRNLQQREHKEDMAHVFSGWEIYKCLDYVSCWFVLAGKYIQHTGIRCAFVTTNSITQGQQLPVLWKPLEALDVHIFFACTSFKWTNNAKYQAGITCVIIGLESSKGKSKKTLYCGEKKKSVEYISPYLTEKRTPYIVPSQRSISHLPPIAYGNQPNDGGNLIIENEDYPRFLSSTPDIGKYLYNLTGAEEFVRGKQRHCLWLCDATQEEISSNPLLLSRIDACRKKRLASTRAATRELAATPHLMGFISYKPTDAIIIPCHTSENREYIPMGYVDKNTIISNSAFAIYDAEPWLFAILTSRMHMAWMRATCGRLKTDYRYSASLCYNTFPLRELRAEEKELLAQSAFAVIDAREAFPGKTPKDLYEPAAMPDLLRQAHDALDHLVDSLYRKKAFLNDDERLECLLELYQHMTTPHE